MGYLARPCRVAAIGWLPLCLLMCGHLWGEDRYGDLVREDRPVVWYRMAEDAQVSTVANAATSVSENSVAAETFVGQVHGNWRLGAEGPAPPRFPDFAPHRTAASLDGGAASLRVADHTGPSRLKFTTGDEITLEAWVRPRALGSVSYLIGKGRTRQDGFGDRNQNYSLRLVSQAGQLHLSFFFCDADSDEAARRKKLDGHRWTSDQGFPLDGDWHHVAVSYRFGEPDTIRGTIDGQPVGGKWDLGGPTDKAPAVDDDQLWIGASMGGNSGVFSGEMAEVAIYAKILPEERLRLRYRTSGVKPQGRAIGDVPPEEIPDDEVRVTLTEPVPASRNWDFILNRGPTLTWTTDRFALTRVPHKYTSKGLIDDVGLPFLITAASRVEVDAAEAGTHEFALRALSASRLYIDGNLVAQTPFQSLAQSGHGKLHELKPPEPGLLSLPAAHTEKRVEVELDAGQHEVVLEAIVGHPGRMPRVGELAIGVRRPGRSAFEVLSPTKEIPFDDATWLAFLETEEERLDKLNQAARAALDQQEKAWWDRRHAITRQIAQQLPTPEVPMVKNGAAVANDIDRFLQHRLEEEGVAPEALVDDLAFLRRVTLDVAGVIPTPSEVEKFLADPPESRRSLAIERLLADPRWADHWVPYWQDVLAENVGLAKPTLNNTGPFRYFIHSAFLDNRPVDRFVTELTLMEGSKFLGGPAGFGVATQNDVPMAAKAHVLGTAFLAVEMKCARCHDSPLHDVSQEDLFSLAALLKRTEVKVPLSSSIPGTPEQLREMLVEVTLKPGTDVAPQWPFAELNDLNLEDIPDEAIRNRNDPREQFALQMTWPTNQRFAQVVANRVWKRYMGRGLAEPVHDFAYASISHPELLDYLARELVLHDYDLKHLARLILNSQAYQRRPAAEGSPAAAQPERFAAAIERRLTAEQLVDSLHLAAGKKIDSEELTLDRDGRQKIDAFVSLGWPERAWEMAATSNERDRPSTIWHKAQSVVDLLGAFGWRQSRPDPITEREATMTPLMPMALAHGPTVQQVIDLSDRGGVTQLALEDQPVETLIERLFVRVLTRSPSPAERALFVELLSPGYETRVVAGPEVVPPPKIHRSPRSWANNLQAEANAVSLREQAEMLKGDPPTQRLDADWRLRMEEALWTLVNLPEFVFAP